MTGRFVRVPSERDRIVGLLLALDAAVRLLSSEENEKQIERLALLVRELEWACSGLTDGDGDPYEALAPIAYGVPEWLRGDDSGLAAVVESLRERPASNGNGSAPAGAERPHDVWRAVAGQIRPQEGPSAANRQRDLDTLEWLKMTLDEEREGPALRSAGFDLTDVAQASSAAAEQLDADLDPRSVDVAWRLLRIDVPVVVRRDLTRSGVLIGLECWFAPPPGDGSDPGHPGAEPVGPAEAPGELCMTPSFIAGVRDGHAAALDLLERLGAEEQRRRVASLRFRAVGVMPPFVLDERSAGLPTALHVIGTALNLPVPDVVTSGPIARDVGSVLEPMDADDVQAKLDAVGTDGFRDTLLAHVADPPLEAPGLRVLGSPRLADACLAVWGEDWLARRREIVGARLRERGFAVAWSPGEIEVPLERHRNQEVLVFPLPEAERLAELLDENHPFGSVAQGEAASGKTMFARQVCQLLHDRSEHTWLTVRVTVDPALLRDDDHATVIGLARTALEGEPASRKLLVVDDLRAHADFKELAGFVNALRIALEDVSVLALSELYKETERWNTDGVHVGSFNERRSESFDQPLFAAFPALDVGRERIRLAERVSGQANIGMFIKCLSHLAENPAVTEDSAMWDWILGGFDDDLNESQRERVAYLAALSSRRLATSPEMLRDVPERILARLGARRRDDGWVIPSTPVQAAILIRDVPGQVPWRYDGWRLKGLSAEAMARVLDKLPADEAAEAAVGLMMASRLGDRWLERVLASRLDGVMRLLRKRSDTTAVLAVLLKKHHRVLEPADRKEWTLELARRMTRSMRALSVPELANGIEALWLNQRHLEDDSVIDELTSVLDRDLATVLLNDERTGVQGRVRLMRQMFRFRVTNNGEILHRNARHFLKGANPRRPGHFRAIREATRYVDLGERESAAADGEAGVRFDLADGVTVRTLVPSQAVIAPLGEIEPMLREPDEDATSGVFLGWLELRLAFEERGTDWDGIVAPIIEPLCASIARTSLDELTEAVEHLARHHRDFCLRLLGMRALVTPFVKRLEWAEPSKAAQFINLLNRLRPGTAFEVLYDGDRPRRKLADRFVERLVRLRDAKAAGQLIKATWRVDELYGTVEKGFGRHIGDGLGIDFVTDRLTRDPRTSVLFHLVEALTWARVDFLEDAAGPAIDHIAETIRQDGRPQAPRLARHLASDDVLGSRGTADDFIAKLRGALDLDNGIDLMVRRMTGADDPEQIAAFNELAAAVDGAGSELAEAFADRFSAEWLREAAPARARG
ncbi:MAG: hypothetical protein M3389_07195, partial [Actinomycetota bacterium]|nr:hypothetical protein [Actinomycetota bacterium]